MTVLTLLSRELIPVLFTLLVGLVGGVLGAVLYEYLTRLWTRKRRPPEQTRREELRYPVPYSLEALAQYLGLEHVVIFTSDGYVVEHLGPAPSEAEVRTLLTTYIAVREHDVRARDFLLTTPETTHLFITLDRRGHYILYARTRGEFKRSDLARIRDVVQKYSEVRGYTY